MKTKVDGEGFKAWTEYWGMLWNDNESQPGISLLYGFENRSFINRTRHQATVERTGSCFGFVMAGSVVVNPGRVGSAVLVEGQFFQTPGGCELDLQDKTAVMVVQRLDLRGYNYQGGPIEERGRMRYIDGCTDTLLVPPMLKGDPCLNHLHFPVGIDQTEHTHPSTRMGCVASGLGRCVTPDVTSELEPGMLFYIHTDGRHKFQTPHGQYMNVIAYHPDSDFGPTHENHPMVNRTIVDGAKIDNTQSRHAADFIQGTHA